MKTRQKVCLISSDDLIRSCDAIPAIKNRAHMVHSLLDALKLTEKLILVSSVKATEEDIRKFHSEEYVDFLKLSNTENHDNETEDSFGLGFDCPAFENIWPIVTQLAGASLTAANELIDGNTNIAINWCGGWHHAQRDSASGFCYVNDIVLAIQRLRTKFDRILYIDLDIHHGDGVENAFLFSPKIFTFSLHLLENGFFPGTGESTETGLGKGKNYNMNIPYSPDINDEEFNHLFESVIYEIFEVFHPNAIVCQCGADALNGDPLGEGNLSSKGYLDCIKHILQLNLPLLILGGGGYNKANTSKLWSAITATLIGEAIPEEIPEHNYFPLYGPDFETSMTVGLRKSKNSPKSLQETIQRALGNLEKLRMSKQVTHTQ